MKLIKYLGTALIAVIFFNCSSTVDPVYKDLQWYNTQTSPIFDYETKALEAFKSVSGKNYTNDKTMLATIKKTAIPNMITFQNKMKSVHPLTNEVSGFHKIYLKKIDANLRYFQMIKKGLKQSDKAIIIEASKLLKKSNQYYKKWIDQLDKMKNDHDF